MTQEFFKSMKTEFLRYKHDYTVNVQSKYLPKFYNKNLPVYNGKHFKYKIFLHTYAILDIFLHKCHFNN